MLVVLGALPADAQQPTSDLVGRYRAAFMQREVARFEERFGARRGLSVTWTRTTAAAATDGEGVPR